MSVVQLADVGPVVATTDVDDAIIGVLKEQYPTWLLIQGGEREMTLPAPKPAGYANALDQDEWLDHFMPAVLVTTSETSGRPMRHSDGTIEVGWNVVASVIVRGTTPSETRTRASMYEAALRRCLGHRNAIANAGGILHSARWQSSKLAPVSNVSRQGRYLVAGMVTFLVLTDYALKDAGGPAQPGPGPFVPTATVTEVDTSDIEGFTPGQDLPGGP